MIVVTAVVTNLPYEPLSDQLRQCQTAGAAAAQ